MISPLSAMVELHAAIELDSTKVWEDYPAKKLKQPLHKRSPKQTANFANKKTREKLYTPPLPPHFWLKDIFQGRGVGVYILGPHAAGILYPPLLYTPHP